MPAPSPIRITHGDFDLSALASALGQRPSQGSGASAAVHAAALQARQRERESERAAQMALVREQHLGRLSGSPTRPAGGVQTVYGRDLLQAGRPTNDPSFNDRYARMSGATYTPDGAPFNVGAGGGGVDAPQLGSEMASYLKSAGIPEGERGILEKLLPSLPPKQQAALINQTLNRLGLNTRADSTHERKVELEKLRNEYRTRLQTDRQQFQKDLQDGRLDAQVAAQALMEEGKDRRHQGGIDAATTRQQNAQASRERRDASNRIYETYGVDTNAYPDYNTWLEAAAAESVTREKDAGVGLFGSYTPQDTFAQQIANSPRGRAMRRFYETQAAGASDLSQASDADLFKIIMQQQ